MKVPNYSGRMDNLRASLLNEQLLELERNCTHWNTLYDFMVQQMRNIDGIEIPQRDPKEKYVGSSMQFSIPTLSEQQIITFQQNCLHRGVELKWFGNEHPTGFTSRYDSWQFIDEIPKLPNTHAILAKTLDMRIPLTFEKQDLSLIAQIIKEEFTPFRIN